MVKFAISFNNYIFK